jgi:hypothetical protein
MKTSKLFSVLKGFSLYFLLGKVAVPINVGRVIGVTSLQHCGEGGGGWV